MRRSEHRSENSPAITSPRDPGPGRRDLQLPIPTTEKTLAILRVAKGHGCGRDFKGLQPRHARLTIGAASTFVDFVLDHYLSRVSTEPVDG